jgi:group I intron endonuclease
MAYIYRILNKLTKKCYIGETKCIDVSRRWNQHKQTIEINKGCPALRDAVKKYGIDNFEFSVLIICFDDERFKYEIEYIKKYNSVVPNGYNITNGGEGGGFQGKTHTEEVKNIIKNKLKQKFIDNPELKKQMSERNKIVMKNPEVREKIKNGISNSEKYQKAIRAPRPSVKRKISEGLKKYHNENHSSNILKHREAMAKSVGVNICQYDLNNTLISTFISFNDASRQTGVPSSTIKKCVKDNKTNRGFIWKKE